MDWLALADWLNLAARWAHITFGAAWIGTSFYFVWMNNSFLPPKEPREGVAGELWQVHGGHFYKVDKVRVSQGGLPDHLHWFKWEAYLTWVTGFLLICLIYYLGADLFLVEPATGLTSWQAIGLSLTTLFGGWAGYHLLCKSPLGRHNGRFLAVMAPLFAFVVWGLTEAFQARAAYLHVGALLGTCMAFNVFFVIIPNQRVMVEQMLRGEEPDHALGEMAAQRSLHNNYLTLPVLFLMVSNHYPVTYGSPWSWAILLALAAIGGWIKHFVNLAERGLPRTWMVPVGAVAFLVLAVLATPRPAEPAADAAQAPSFGAARKVLNDRCLPCHSMSPTWPGIPAPPLGFVLDTPEQIANGAAKIAERAVHNETMPLGNVTQMTTEERELLGAWVAAGAPL